MAKFKILKILNIGLISGLAVSLLSFFIPIVPCTKSPVIAQPEYNWGLCKLPNPFKEPVLGLSQKFYSVSPEPLGGFILQTLLILIIVTAIFTIFEKKQDKVLDLTKKRK